ncbi:MAG: type II secretion system protein GspK [Kiritimatiellae bacterium]|nr:type II secretion system protein GspK [Kiritimatiellia bacterium]
MKTDDVQHVTRGVPSAKGGSALILVLWVIGMLAMFISNMAFDAHIEARITSYYRKRHKAASLAHSGVELAKMIMEKILEIDPNYEEEPPEDDPWYLDAKRLAQGSSLSATYPLGEGEFHLAIVTEQARRNVNLLTKEEEWEPILAVGDIPEDLWPDLIEAFLDWVDKDDIERSDGAETEDYYATLENPYGARNGALYSVDELIRIKGFTQAIIYGGLLAGESGDDGEPVVVSGIADLLTTYGGKKINVNAASRRVLMTLPDPEGIADLVAGAIFEELEGFEGDDGTTEPEFFEDDADLFRSVPELSQGGRKAYVTTKASQYYRITSTGRMKGVERKVSCIVVRSKGDLRILKWEESED